MKLAPAAVAVARPAFIGAITLAAMFWMFVVTMAVVQDMVVAIIVLFALLLTAVPVLAGLSTRSSRR